MTNLVSEQLQSYFEALEKSLKLETSQKQDIIDEIRGNTVERISSLCREGIPEPQATAQALSELGSPSDLARNILQESPPFNASLLVWTRYLLFAPLFLFAIFAGLAFRASFFGPSLIFYAVWVGIFLPALVLCWPTIVWRFNWLFSFLPTLAIFGIIIFTSTFAMQHSEQVQRMPSPNNASVDVPNSSFPLIAALLFGSLAIFVLNMIQQRQQQRLVIGLTCVAMLLVELPYFWEEQQIRGYANVVVAHQKQNGKLPTLDEFARTSFSNRTESPNISYQLDPQTTQFKISKDRVLFPGHRIIYSGPSGEVVVTD